MPRIPRPADTAINTTIGLAFWACLFWAAGRLLGWS
ncbi:hypothetical protein [Caulobacter phage KcrB]|nr:hypothetical protein RW_GP022 [Caulobacter phage RW]WCA46326.1 hypothetical protein [Caulobacter phage KcrB]WCD56261.1 hypothetical protein [Caulobacter phage RLK]WNV48053.1 hypothetical protein GB2A_gp021 [Caulobacter phage GB2A]